MEDFEINDPIYNEVVRQNSPDFLTEAKKEFPYLRDKEIDIYFNPKQNENRLLEFYPPDEPGSPEMPRPKELPMGRIGVEVFSPKVRPIDILGDYVSHYGVFNDPTLIEPYQRFENSLDPRLMQQRYEFHKSQFGEQRPFEDWMRMTGVPEMFRGYTFNQFENPSDLYTPEQLQILDEIRKNLGIQK